DSVYSELDIAGIFTKSGNYVEANRILSATDVSLMSNDMRLYYYSLYGELYEALRQTAITSIQREYYERRRLLYRDSLKNLNVLKSDWRPEGSQGILP
ncbi:regulatory protein SusR, partial [human gut metagenome]